MNGIFKYPIHHFKVRNYAFSFICDNAVWQALASWSPQEVGRPLQEMPPSFLITSSTGRPSTSLETA